MSPRMAAALRDSEEIGRRKKLRQEWVRVDGVWYRSKRPLFDGAFDALSQQPNRPLPVAGAEKGSSGGATSRVPAVRNGEN